jgi:peptidoglycan/xylan/chitin deacetylase (PgdA/CDA1 family)
MKNIVRNILAELVGFWHLLSGKIKRAKKGALNGEYILSIYFHKPSSKLFEFVIRWLLKNGFTIIPSKQIEKIVAGKIPFPKATAIITVDDGWRSNIKNIVAIAKQYQIPVTIFAATEAVEMGGGYWWTYVNKAQKLNLTTHNAEALKKVNNVERIKVVNELKDVLNLDREAMYPEELQSVSESKYITIGSHTVTHPILPNCNDDEAQFEIKESKKKLEHLLGKKIDEFAYPNGDYGKRELELLEKNGYKLAFTTKTNYLTKERLIDKLEIPRFEIWEDAGYFETISRITGVWFNSNQKKKN